MKLYHGSQTGGIEFLQPFTSNHGKPYVYLTNNKVLATLYAYNPLTRPYGWFPYWFSKDFKNLFYDEYFKEAAYKIYSGKRGFVYEVEADLPSLDNMPWVYVSETPVKIIGCEVVEDIYTQLLDYQSVGQIEIIPNSKIKPEIIDKIVIKEINKYGYNKNSDDEYAVFLKTHFPHLFK